MIRSIERRVVGEDEVIYGEYGEMVDKKLESNITDFSLIA